MRFEIIQPFPECRGLGVELSIDNDLVSESALPIRPNYYDGFNRETYTELVDLEYFLSENYEHKDTQNLCVETPVNKTIASLINFQYKCEPSSGRVYSLLHAGRKSAIAPLHYDWDMRWVLNACLLGRKKFVFVPPESGWILAPVLNTSSYCVPRFSEKDLHEFVEIAAGVEITVQAGQAVIFPSLWWHGVYYEQNSVSISVRFAENPELRPLSVLPRSWLLQRLIAVLDSITKNDRVNVVDGCLKAFCREQDNWLSRYRYCKNIYREYLHEMGKEKGVNYLSAENFDIELSFAEEELRHLYSILAPQDLKAERFCEVRRYLFEGLSDNEFNRQHNLIAGQALRVRQGLRPKRGLFSGDFV